MLQLAIPSLTQELSVEIAPGEPLFVLGANGSGKSTLMHKLFRDHRAVSRRVLAHRQTWMESGTISLSPQDKQQSEINVGNFDNADGSRWRDPYGATRTNVALFDLLDRENVRAREIARFVEQNDYANAGRVAGESAPLKKINELLRLSNISVTVSSDDNFRFMAQRNGSIPYSAAELSDGERSALLLGATVLTAPAGSLLLIDEPERHLNRAVTSPLLANLFRLRPDCYFVVSTHDGDLCADMAEARVVLIRDCIYRDGQPLAWELDLIPSAIDLPENFRRTLIGSRRKILFVEGDNTSLDRPLYALVFPGVSVSAKSSCRDVEHAVTAMRELPDFHWLNVWGIVDNDRRTAEDIEKMRANGIFALDVFSVESIYYHPEIQRRVAFRQASIDGGNAEARLTVATTQALAQIELHKARLARRVAEKELREDMMRQFPKPRDIAAMGVHQVTLDIAQKVRQEVDRLDEALHSGDVTTILYHFPVRETPALGRIAISLGFQGRTQYESAVIKLLLDDGDALQFVQSLFGDLMLEISRA